MASVILFATVATACGDRDPESLTLDLQVSNRALAGDSTLKVGDGDTVMLTITTDEDGELHFHGYDFTHRIVAGETTTFTFVAGLTGRFPIELHAGSADGGGEYADDGHEHDSGEVEVTVGVLQVDPR